MSRHHRSATIPLPELELPDTFDQEKLGEWVGLVARPRLRTMVSRGLANALAGAARSGERSDRSQTDIEVSRPTRRRLPDPFQLEGDPYALSRALDEIRGER